jgi:hydrogenase maturation protease
VAGVKTLVLGLGNPILGDDGAGVEVAASVRAALSPQMNIDVEEACVGGLALMERMIGYDRAILIDALDPGHAPSGTVQRLELADLQRLCPTLHSASAHDTNLVTALEAGRRIGLPLPSQITIFAVAVENVWDFSDSMTPAVARSIPCVVQAVLSELGMQETVHSPKPGG